METMERTFFLICDQVRGANFEELEIIAVMINSMAALLVFNVLVDIRAKRKFDILQRREQEGGEVRGPLREALEWAPDGFF